MSTTPVMPRQESSGPIGPPAQEASLHAEFQAPIVTKAPPTKTVVVAKPPPTKTVVVPKPPPTKTVPSQQTDNDRTSDWDGVQEPFYFYCYSAYLDDRPAKVWPQIAVHAVGQRSKILATNKIRCRIEYEREEDTDNEIGAIATSVADEHDITDHFSNKTFTLGSFAVYERGQKTNSGIKVETRIIHCRVKESNKTPLRVQIYYEKSKICTRPVRIPAKPNVKLDIALCAPSIFSIKMPDCPKCKPMNPLPLISWIEMQRMLGVSLITVYNHSMTAEISEIMDYYKKLEVVEVPSQGPIAGDDFRQPSAISLNDCLYRHLHSFRKILQVDPDEYIVPRNKMSLMQFMLHYAAANNVSFDGAEFWFSNTYFFKDYQTDDIDTSLPEHLEVLKYRYRSHPHPFKKSSKPVIDPLACKIVHAHQCIDPKVPGVRSDIVMVDPEQAIMHHYKHCGRSRWKAMPCEDYFKDMVQDDIMTVFKDGLMERVEKVILALKL